MPNYINFIKKEAAQFHKKTKTLFLIRFISLAVIIVYTAILITAISLQALLKKRNNKLDIQINNKKEVIEKQRSKETKYFLVDQKATALMQLMPGREEKQKNVRSFFELISGEVELNNLSFAEDGRVNLSANCTTLKQLENFIGKIRRETTTLELTIKEAQVSSITYNPKDGYDLTGYIIFAEK